jgi:antitoxin (DNA-binding transcriptional repressor) of toxin-antitoxin stability system
MSVFKVSVREARQNFRRLLDRVQAGAEVVVLRRGVELRKARQTGAQPGAPSRPGLLPRFGEGERPAAESGDRREPPELPLLICVNTSVLVAYYCPEPPTGTVQGLLPVSYLK